MDGARAHMLAQPQDAGSCDCQLQEHLCAIGADRAFDIDPAQLALDSKGPARRAGISTQDQACVTSEIGGVDRQTMTGEGGWAWAKKPPRNGEIARHEPGVLERAHAQ